MTVLIYLIPAALFLGLLGLGAFLWAMKSGQFEDLDGAAGRILYDDEPPQDDAHKPSRGARAAQWASQRRCGTPL